MAYVVQNRRLPRPIHRGNSGPAASVPQEQVTDYPWFIPTCKNRANATEILSACSKIENGNFLVRHSENKTAKYTITLWFNHTATHVRVHQLSNGHYRLDFQSTCALQMPTFGTMKELIEYYCEHEMKLSGHCQDNRMTNTIDCDPYFDDEDEENEENYRQSLKKRQPIPSSPSRIIPVTSPTQRCTLCTRQEAEKSLKINPDVQLGNFILRPSTHANHPYSLSVLYENGMVFHFQIGQIGKEYLIGPLESIDPSKSKKFPSISALLEYHLKSPIAIQENDKKYSVHLQLYSPIEETQF